MKVLLKTDVKGVGKAGQIINAKDGYAKNYLLPRGFAVAATPAVLSEIEAKNTALQHHAQMALEAAQEAAQKLDGAVIEIGARGGVTKLFGSVTSGEAAAAVSSFLGEEIDRRRISVPEIKTYGDYTAVIKLHTDVSASVTLRVVKAE